MIAVASAAWLFTRDGLRTPPALVASPAKIHSIAVLPLQNLSKDPAEDYFADGMTDALITKLRANRRTKCTFEERRDAIQRDE